MGHRKFVFFKHSQKRYLKNEIVAVSELISPSLGYSMKEKSVGACDIGQEGDILSLKMGS